MRCECAWRTLACKMGRDKVRIVVKSETLGYLAVMSGKANFLFQLGAFHYK